VYKIQVGAGRKKKQEGATAVVSMPEPRLRSRRLTFDAEKEQSCWFGAFCPFVFPSTPSDSSRDAERSSGTPDSSFDGNNQSFMSKTPNYYDHNDSKKRYSPLTRHSHSAPGGIYTDPSVTHTSDEETSMSTASSAKNTQSSNLGTSKLLSNIKLGHNFDENPYYFDKYSSKKQQQQQQQQQQHTSGGTLKGIKSLTSLHSWNADGRGSDHGKHRRDSSGQEPFENMNLMYQRVGVRLETRPRQFSGSSDQGDNIGVEGDAHIARLHAACKEQMIRLLAENEKASQATACTISRDNSSLFSKEEWGNGPVIQSVLRTGSTDSTDSPLAAAIQPILVAAPPLAMADARFGFGNSGLDVCDGSSNNSIIKMSEVAIAYSEVLQLKGEINEAIAVISKALDGLENDHGYTFVEAQSVYIPHIALCHRRLGSLYKIIGKLYEAEENVRRYIFLVRKTTSDPTLIAKDLSNAYSLLATILEETDRSEEAQEADRLAMETISTL